MTTCLGDYNILIDRQQQIRIDETSLYIVELRIHFIGESTVREVEEESLAEIQISLN